MDENRRMIFLEELEKLRNARLIPERDFRKLRSLHEWYSLNVRQPEQNGEAVPNSPSEGASGLPREAASGFLGETASGLPREAAPQPPAPPWIRYQSQPGLPYDRSHGGSQAQPQGSPTGQPQGDAPGQTKYRTGVQQQTPAQPRPARILSPQEIRDRNITWILVLGVVFVLLAGLILATSSWNMMGSIAKTAVITFVAILFFGLSIFTDKTLKIRKTGFAFWVLGSLFLPVAVLSAGFFELFGSWFSVSGEGRFLLGVLGASLCIPVYAYSSSKYANRFFTWLTLVTISLDVVFLIAAFHPPVDLFYLGIALYNGLIVALFATKGLPAKLNRFTEAFPAFVQINLFISALFMLLFFDQSALHGINLLLMAALYILMTFSGGRKEYGIVFSGLLVFGVWYIVENSPLASMDVVLFALVGFLFLGFERIARDREFLKKTFVYASGFISLCTFLFVNLRGILLNTDSASFAVLAAHLLVAANYGYLAYRTKKPVFAWLTPLFLISAGHQGFNLIEVAHADYSYPLHMFLLSVLMFVFLFLLNRWKYITSIRTPNGVLSLVLMTITAGLAAVQEEWSLTSLIFASLGCALYLVYRKVERPLSRTLLKISFPLVSVLALASLYGVLPPSVDSWYNGALHFGLIALLLFLASIMFRKIETSLEAPFFWAAQILIPLAVLSLFDDYHANPLIFLLPAAIYFYSMTRDFRGRENRVSSSVDEANAGHASASARTHLIQACSFLYLLYSACILALFSSTEALKLPDDASCYVFPVAAFLLALLWLLLKNEWKSRTFWYFIPVSILSVPSLLSVWTFALPQLILSLMCITLTLVVLHWGKQSQLVFVPLLLLIPLADESFRSLLDNNLPARLVSLIVLFLLLKYTGEFLFKGLLEKNPDAKGLWAILPDWYAVGALAVLPFLGHLADSTDLSEWLSMIAPSLLTFLLFSQRNRVGNAKRIVHTLWIVSVMLPYLTLLSILDPPSVIRTELFCLPLLVITLVLSIRIWPGREDLFRKIQLVVLLVIAALLIRDILLYGYLADALITGILSLAAVFVGMQFRIKSYFFVGSGTLLLNALIQTQSFWASIPWWGYLLIAGLALIAIASLNEMQKGERETPSKFSRQAVLNKFKGWH